MRILWIFFVFLMLFLVTYSGSGEEGELSLQQLFQLDSLDDLFTSLFVTLTEYHPALEGISYQGGSLHHYNGDYFLYTKEYSLYFTPLHVEAHGLHFFIHLQHQFVDDVGTILAWDGAFTAVPLLDPIPLYNYLVAEGLYLDETRRGIGIQGATGAVVGRMGEYFIYQYHSGEGYRRIWTLPTPSVKILETRPLQLFTIEYTNWDETFPFHDLSSYCSICLGLFSRQFGTLYRWEKEKGTFVKGEPQEIFGELAVVNHLLKALMEQDLEEAAPFVTRNLLEEMDILSLPFLSEGHLFVYPDIYEWAPKVNYSGAGPLVNILFSRNMKGELDLLEDEIEYVVLFALTETDPPLVRDIYCQPFPMF